MHIIKLEFIQNLADIKVTGKAMKMPMFLGVFLLGSLLSVLLVEAQESPPLIQFNNGEAADAHDVNSNFNNHEQRLQALEQYQGCSAAQDVGSVVITCADGSSGVLASAGTVVVVQGSTGQTPDISAIPSGNFYLVDGNGDALAYYGGATIALPVYFGIGMETGGRAKEALVLYFEDQARLVVSSAALTSQMKIWYASEDCNGPEFVDSSNSDWLLDLGGGGVLEYRLAF